MKKLALTFFLFGAIAGAEEVSAFGAGDLNSKNPYGLNSTEKNLLKTRKTLENVDSKVKDVKLSLESINERIDGLESIYEGDSQKLNTSVLKINEIIKKVEENSTLTEKHRADIEQILLMQEEFAKNIANLKLAVKKLSDTINKINKSYISEKEFKSNMSQFITREEFEALKKSLGVKTSNKSTAKPKTKKVSSDLSSEDMFNEAYRLFKKDWFTKAIPMFEELIERDYKPAASNFYLGNMWYYREKYDDAIRYFKTSAMLYDKADYMPELLLHSAIAFEETNDLGNAVNFYTSVIDIYPNSKEAKEAEKKLRKLK
ncbi:tetratricopeptide repeat protein [Arcobacter arenosus]|jgi:TolA-binding protein|uniref:Tetratricopeptide repeat protein n=1 Tax=Arcobacter arenosus TaxID=2576037 RepID=A0A5R8XZ25_9BACT|nr:tetratricopeptide repeat protein [Arcobacter arenosus]TLP36847.1 tetratricopeptide repeat protein [Arcobacter arenosus]